MADNQLAFESILEETFKIRESLIDKYIQANRLKYVSFARTIAPNLQDWAQVWDRLAFAILSANTPFDDSVKALAYVTDHKGHASPSYLAVFKCVPAKADYLNLLPRGKRVFTLLKGDKEDWQAYRLRLFRTVKGLGLAKASFAASLLYPMTSDLACLDTWMQKHYLRRSSFKQLGQRDYVKVEARVRQVAKRNLLPSTFLAQWMIWDSLRNETNNHAIFPSSHKEY